MRLEAKLFGVQPVGIAISWSHFVAIPLISADSLFVGSFHGVAPSTEEIRTVREFIKV
jgi:hypothetical protein